MIICHEYRFIFLKNNKCAGSSVEMALSQFCSPGDVITTLQKDEEEQRRAMGFQGCQNYQIPPEYYTLSDKLAARTKEKPPRYDSHIRARDLVPRIDPAIWKDYFKFVIVRNPWDRVASLHFHRARDAVRTTKEKSGVVKNKTLKRFNDQGWGLYTINDKLVVDHCCRYENLGEELEAVRQKLGLPKPIELPNAKGSYRKKKGKQSYRELFSEDEKNRIAKYFRKEIEMFGYEF